MSNHPLRREAPRIEPLETRRLLSGAVTDVNISRSPGNQAEGAIAVDRADPSKLFAVSNIDVGDGLLVATSSDGGATFSHRVIADDTDHLPPACCDPSAAFDSYGNLFLAYLNSKDNQIELLLSTDAGNSFKLLKEYSGDVDQPTVVTASGVVWLDFDHNNGVAATGASVGGLGQVGNFEPLQQVRGSTGGDFGDVAVGPAGQVFVTYQKGSRVFVNVNPTGLGGSFGKPIPVTSMHVANFDTVPAQSKRGIDSEAGLAIDRSGGPFTGRVYLVYTDQTPARSSNTDVFVRYSDNGGSVWSNPIRVNDDPGLNSQLLPRISIDPASGRVGVSWYDARYDTGTGGAEDLDNVPNDDVEYFAAVLTPTTDGLRVSANQQVSQGPTNAADANSSIDLGDYTGLDFAAGMLHPLWFDNSNSTGDNPNGTHRALNAYTATVPADTFAAGTLELGGLRASAGPLALLQLGAASQLSAHARSFTFNVLYVSAAGLNAASISDANIVVTPPAGMAIPAQVVRSRIKAHGSQRLVTYRVTGSFGRTGDGTYAITLLPNQVTDALGTAAVAGTLGTFVVDV